MANILYDVIQLSFSYQSKKVLENIDLKIEEKDFLMILGPNGSGKTTLIKCLLGVLKDFTGTINFLNKSITKFPTKKLAQNVAYVSQNVYLNFDYSVKEILQMGRYCYSGFFSSGEKSNNLLKEVMAYLDIEKLSDCNINELSGGEMQRVMIGRALMQEPKVLILDEPVSHLDIKHQVAIYNLLKNLNEDKGVTIIMVSHDLNFANRYGKRILLMKEGKIVFDGKNSQILNKNNIKEIFEVDTEFYNLEGEESLCIVIKN